MRKIFIVAAILSGSLLYAQDSTIVSADQHPLDHVVITTHKYPVKQSQTGKVVTVIDRQLIEQLGGRTISEMINTIAGTIVNGANNTLGTNQRMSIRGSSDGNVLILVDGIPINDPSVLTNYFDLNFFNASEVERIEILKGGQSTLYGSDAVAGVVNIITKKASTQRAVPHFSAGFGSYGTMNSTLGIKGKSKKINYNLAASVVRSAGFSAAHDTTGAGHHDNDGYHQYNLRGEMGFQLSDKLNARIFSNYSHYNADIDAAAFTNDNDFTARNRNVQIGSGLIWKHGKGTLHINYHFNYVDRFYLDDSTDRPSFSYYSVSNYIGRSHFAEVYENYKWNKFSLLAGIDHRLFNTSQEYNSISMFGPFNTRLEDTAGMWQTSPYASVIYNHKNLNIELGGRWNHHSVYGNNFTYTFNPSYLIRQRLKIFTNVSSAFKTPTLYQLFDPYIGNTSLDPENSLILEGGVEIYSKNWSLRVTDFYRNTDNAIQFIITDPVFFSGHYLNVSNQKNYGVEAEFNYRSVKWNVHSNYTYTQGKISSNYSESGNQLAKDTTYNNLYRVPEHAFNLMAGYTINKKFSVSTLIKYVDSRLEPVYASSPVKLDPYYTIDLSAQYRFSKKARLFTDLKNITGQRYFDILGYNSRRFNFFIGMDIQF